MQVDKLVMTAFWDLLLRRDNFRLFPIYRDHLNVGIKHQHSEVLAHIR